MQILIYSLIAFALLGFFCTVVCVICGTDLSELLPVYNPRKKKVGASFWGAYVEGQKEDESFKLPKIYSHDEGYIVGSTKYAKGKAVKSCRS